MQETQVFTAFGTHDEQARQRHGVGARQRRGVGQQRRGDADDPACGGGGAEQWQQQAQLADARAVGEEFDERTGRPAATGQLGVERGEAGRQHRPASLCEPARLPHAARRQAGKHVMRAGGDGNGGVQRRVGVALEREGHGGRGIGSLSGPCGSAPP